MRRREFIAGLGGAAAWPIVTRAQQPGLMKRVGVLMPFAKGDSEFEERVRIFRQELVRLGWTEGKNIQFDERWTTDNMEQVRATMKRLVQHLLHKGQGHDPEQVAKFVARMNGLVPGLFK